jgi:four helix bundle protein
MQRFQDLKVWQRSHQLTLEVYRLSRGFPREERYGLTSQIRRAAVSVPCNIAEGSKRARPIDYARFLNMSESSLAEVEYLLILSRDLGYAAQEKTASLVHEAEEISQMLFRLRARVLKNSETVDCRLSTVD